MPVLKLVDGTELSLPSNSKQAARFLADMIRSNGHVPNSDQKVSWKSFAETISPKNKDLVKASEITPLLCCRIASRYTRVTSWAFHSLISFAETILLARSSVEVFVDVAGHFVPCFAVL